MPRFIPTCMGNSTPAGNDRRVTTVHPHVHGELGKNLWKDKPRTGSSPRAWGTLVVWGLWKLGVRFIPTCMGNS